MQWRNSGRVSDEGHPWLFFSGALLVSRAARRGSPVVMPQHPAQQQNSHTLPRDVTTAIHIKGTAFAQDVLGVGRNLFLG